MTARRRNTRVFRYRERQLLVGTNADWSKVKRIRRDAHVRIAACDARGRLRGEPVGAEARILPNSERERVEQLSAQVPDRPFTVYPLYRLVTRLRGDGSRTNEGPVALEMTPK